MSFEGDGEMFFEEDFVNTGTQNGKKKDYSEELPPPYPPTMMREKPKAESKTEKQPVGQGEATDGLEKALVQIVHRLTLYGEKGKAKPKVSVEDEDESKLLPNPREAGYAEDKTKNEQGDEEAEQLKSAMNDFLARLETFGLKQTDGEEEEEEEAVDDSQWKEEEREEKDEEEDYKEDMGANKGRKSVYSEEFVTRKSGYSPLSQKEDGMAFKDLSDRIKAFYMKFDRVKLIEGIGHVVEWTLENGEEKLNLKLQTKYGADLNTFEETEAKPMRGASKAKAEWATEGATQATGKKEEKERKEDGEEAGEHEGLNAQEKDRLIELIKRHEASNLERRIYKAVKYAKKNGVADLNQRLLRRYGENLEEKSTPSKVVDLNDFGVRMLHLFYSKYDPVFVEKGGLAQVRIWTKRNGIHALDRKLKRKYNESLMDFSNRAGELEAALRMFYKLVDAQRTRREVDQVVTWGLINGASALNRNLREKYGKDLSAVEGREWTKSVEVFS